MSYIQLRLRSKVMPPWALEQTITRWWQENRFDILVVLVLPESLYFVEKIFSQMKEYLD